MKYIFFDLDETLSDHKHACQKGIEAIIEVHDCLRVKTAEQLENEFWQMLNGNYNHVLNGSLSMKDTRLQRIAALFTGCYVDPPQHLEELANLYVNHYELALRAIPGVIELLKLLKENEYKMAIITNGFQKVQHKKIQTCKLNAYIDHIITSEEVGVTKPDARIYREALRICNVSPNEVIMVGDSWENDIKGAHALGIKTIWLNRRNELCPDGSITNVIYEPSEIMDILNL
jgi:2-haloalkanoic acid dehalogenase type II